MRIHLDTSVLAKRYLFEPASAQVDVLLQREDALFGISELVLVEMESIVARRRREPGGRSVDWEAVRVRWDNDLRSGFFHVSPLERDVLSEARRLIFEGDAPLATLDALHLSTAIRHKADTIATDDRQLARAARDAGLAVITFI